MDLPRVILILGPTASGKSALALALASQLLNRAEIVTADSMQIYRGMDVGTAKPTAAEQALVPHHLIDVASPYEEGYTVENWLTDAHTAIASVAQRGRTAIVVGGTNLYVQALISGLFEGPAADEGLRAQLRTQPLEQLHAQLTRIDLAAAQRIHRNDQRRIIRAIEVFTLTGIKLTDHQQQWNARGPTLPQDWRCCGLLPDSVSNSSAINLRVKGMMASGFLDEVRRLTIVGSLGRQASEAVGYRELSQHLRGEVALDKAFESIKVRTRKLARQQRTWLRRFSHIEGSNWSTDPCGDEKTKIFFQTVLGL